MHVKLLLLFLAGSLLGHAQTIYRDSVAVGSLYTDVDNIHLIDSIGYHIVDTLQVFDRQVLVKSDIACWMEHNNNSDGEVKVVVPYYRMNVEQKEGYVMIVFDNSTKSLDYEGIFVMKYEGNLIAYRAFHMWAGPPLLGIDANPNSISICMGAIDVLLEDIITHNDFFKEGDRSYCFECAEGNTWSQCLDLAIKNWKFD